MQHARNACFFLREGWFGNRRMDYPRKFNAKIAIYGFINQTQFQAAPRFPLRALQICGLNNSNIFASLPS
jgi:hypothetical protein